MLCDMYTNAATTMWQRLHELLALGASSSTSWCLCACGGAVSRSSLEHGSAASAEVTAAVMSPRWRPRTAA